MALHSTVGFGLSALGAWLAGVALDATGGPTKPSACSAVFVVLAIGILMGPLALWWSKRNRDRKIKLMDLMPGLAKARLPVS